MDEQMEAAKMMFTTACRAYLAGEGDAIEKCTAALAEIGDAQADQELVASLAEILDQMEPAEASDLVRASEEGLADERE